MHNVVLAILTAISMHAGWMGSPRPGESLELAALNCSEGMVEEVLLRPTYRVPGASGSAKVERRGGTTTIEIELNSIKPASLFGGDYNTYVLWVVPPKGPAENAGEISLAGGRGRIKASSPHDEFAILITAEPHYLASAPSAFAVFQNEIELEAQSIQQPLVHGLYNFDRSTLDHVKGAKGKVHSEIRQAFTAVRLARRAISAGLANEELTQAKQALNKTLDLWRARRDRDDIAGQARETVRLAVEAQHLAELRALNER